MIRFDTLSDYIIGKLINTHASLKEDYTVLADLTFKGFIDSSDLINYKEPTKEEVLYCVYNKGITTSDTDNVTTTLQDMDIDILVAEDYIQDFNTVIQEFQNNFHNEIVSISGEAVSIKVNGHTGWTKTTLGIYDYDKITLNIKAICFTQYAMFNDYLVYLNYKPVFITNWTVNKQVNVITDGKKRTEERFIVNNKTMVISISGALSTNSVIQVINEEINKPEDCNIYHLYICQKSLANYDSEGNLDIIEYDTDGTTPKGYKETGSEDLVDKFYIKSGTTDHRYGAIGAFNIQLVRAVSN